MKLVINKNELRIIGVALQKQCMFAKGRIGNIDSVFMKKLWKKELKDNRALLRKIRRKKEQI